MVYNSKIAFWKSKLLKKILNIINVANIETSLLIVKKSRTVAETCTRILITKITKCNISTATKGQKTKTHRLNY